jgi:hypothetical protein
MSNNGSQNSSQSDPSITIDWSPYPVTADDHHTTDVTSALSNLTIANPSAIQVVGAAPIYVRTATTTSAQPETTVRPPFLRTTAHNRPYWYDLDPEVYYSDGERRRINPSPTETSLYTDSYAPTPISDRGSQPSSPPRSVSTPSFFTAQTSNTSVTAVSSPAGSDRGSSEEDERAHFLGEGAQRYLGGCRPIRWY